MEARLTYLELPSTDPRRSATFYAAVLGWKIELREDGDPRFADEAAHLIGRFVTGRPSTRDPGMLPYFYVDRVAHAVARVAGVGGEVVTEPYRDGDLWVARLRDPSGNQIGIWQFARDNGRAAT